MTQQQINTGREVINVETGEVVQSVQGIVDRVMPGREDFVANIFNTSAPKALHIQMMKAYGKQLTEVQSYIGQVPVKFGEYAKEPKIVKVLGATPWFSGQFTSQEDNQVKEGYHKVLLKIDEVKYDKIIGADDQIIKIPSNIIIATSGKRVVTWVAQMIEALGAYDWEIPMRVMLRVQPSKEEEIIMVPEDF